MTVPPIILECIARLAAIIIGCWLGYTEVTGTYEYYLAEQGTFNYVVKAVVGVTLASVIVPHFLSKAIRQRRLFRSLVLGIGFLLAIAVIFTAAIHRTSGAADAQEAARKQATRKVEMARANVRSAEAALASDERLTAGECKTGVGKECG